MSARPRESLVSVIMPAFNAGAHLERAVASVLDQTYRKLELIIVDDGSSDGSVDAIASTADARVHLIRQANAGAAAARNRGLRLAAGEYLQFLDADDLLAPDKIAQQLAVLEEDPRLEMVACAWGRFHGADPAAASFVADGLWEPLDPVQWQVRALGDDLMMHPGAWLVSRALVRRAGAWEPTLSLNDDGEFFGRAMLATGRVAFCRQARSYYRSGDVRSLSSARSKAAWNSSIRALSSIRDGLLRREDSARTRAALARAFSRLAVSAFPYHREAFSLAARAARELGRFQPRFEGGRIGSALAEVLGWKFPRRLQALSYALGYQRFGHWRRRR